MKKCLLFIFIFGITFSLYNIKAFAFSNTINNTPGVVIYQSDVCYIFGFTSGDFYTNWSTRYEKWELKNSGTELGYAWPHPTFSNLQDAIAALNEVEYFANTNIPPMNFGANDSIIIVKGQLINDDHNLPIYYYNTPIDVSQCAFFFEPEPGTNLYSMYCFPQELDYGEVVTVHYNNLNNNGFEITSSTVNTLKRCYLDGNTPDYYNSIEYWLEMIDQVKLENDNVIDFLFTTPIYAVYCNFIENNNNPNYNIFSLTEDSWWDDIVDLIGFEDTTLGFIWDWLFGEPDPDYHNVTIDNSPSPTPLPTPKPYRTTLIPDGNGGFEFQYEYEDSNGNTITASAPPEQPKYNGNDLITQPIKMNISGVPVSDIEGVQSLLNVIGEADADYQEGFQVIGQSFSILPPKWFMFFGIPAAIILIAGIIKSLLG